MNSNRRLLNFQWCPGIGCAMMFMPLPRTSDFAMSYAALFTSRLHSSYKVAKLFHNVAQRSNGKTSEMTSSPQRPSRKPAENECKVERRGIPSRFLCLSFRFVAVFFVSQFFFASRRLTNGSAFSSWKPRLFLARNGRTRSLEVGKPTH